MQMEISMKENGKMIKRMERELINTKTEQYLKDFGKMINK